MMRDVQIAGGIIRVRGFASPAEIAALPEKLVFNCTGLGSRDLFGDKELRPVRGQVAILLPQPEIRYAFTGDGYMFPRRTGSSSAERSSPTSGRPSPSRRRSPGSSNPTESCSPASAAPRPPEGALDDTRPFPGET